MIKREYKKKEREYRFLQRVERPISVLGSQCCISGSVLRSDPWLCSGCHNWCQGFESGLQLPQPHTREPLPSVPFLQPRIGPYFILVHWIISYIIFSYIKSYSSTLLRDTRSTLYHHCFQESAVVLCSRWSSKS